MPRNGSGVYSAPSGTLATTLTTIKSPEYNAFVTDLVSDANAARPLVAGGTGATNAVGAADNQSTKGADLASSATTDIGAATGRYVHITGTTTITSFGTKTAGVLRVLTFDGALTLTHNATSLILPNGANILTAAGDVAVFVSEGGGNWRCVSYNHVSMSSPSILSGLTTANNGSWGVDIASGWFRTSSLYVANGSTFNKTLNAVWAAGTGNGGRDAATAVAANATWHLFAIQNNTTGAFDALFSLSATAPTVPTGYTLVGRISSHVVNSGNTAIVTYTQVLNDFYLSAVDAMAFTVSQTEALLTTTAACPCPSGVSVEMRATAKTVNSSGITDARFSDASSFGTGSVLDIWGYISTATTLYMAGKIKTNTSRQVRVTVSISGTATVTLTFGGWCDYAIPRLGA